MRTIEFEDGQQIFAQGDESDLAYTIVAGQVEIAADGRVLALLDSGSVFGEMGLVDEAPRSADAKAVGTLKVTAMNHEEFVGALTTKPDICMHYLQSLFERLRQANHSFQMAPTESCLETDAYELGKEVPAGLEAEATLIAQTEESRHALGAERVAIGGYPFKIGRRSRNPFGMNDLLLEDSQPYQISRNHLAFREVGGKLVVEDRGSFLGSSVNGSGIGGKHPLKQVELGAGEHRLVLGAEGSPFEFVLKLSEAQV